MDDLMFKCSNNFKKLEKRERQEMPKRQEDNRFVAILEHKQTTHTHMSARKRGKGER